MRGKDPPREELRCKRTDGRQWRCKRQAMVGKTLCDIHYLQGKHRQNREKVPESLKLERKVTKKRAKNGDTVRVRKLKQVSLAAERRKRQAVSEALDDVLKKMKLRSGDLQLELIREFLKRQVAKKNEKEKELKDNVLADETRKLPYGVMAISPSPVSLEKFGECNGGLDVKLGVNLHENPVLQRHFRSKNIEPLPIGTLQIVPFAGNMKRRKTRKCHWCKQSKGRLLIKCLACRKQFFCVFCLKQRHIQKQAAEMKCPACCGTCSCNICEKQQNKAVGHKECYSGKRKVNKIKLLHYLIYMLLPVLKQINHDHSIELESEAMVTGIGNPQSEIQISQANLSFHKLLCCDRCKSAITDYHRTCMNCSYNLCLSCCREISRHSSYGSCMRKSLKKRKIIASVDDLIFKRHISRQNSGEIPRLFPTPLLIWEPSSDGSIPCPPIDIGGCGSSNLDLKCVYPCTWNRDLEVRAEEMLRLYHLPETADFSLCCSRCQDISHKDGDAKVQKGSYRKLGYQDNYLYCPSIHDMRDESPEHFQSHWTKGQPVVVRNVLRRTSSLCWDPVIMFSSYMENKISEHCIENDMKVTNCIDWCEVEIDRKRIFMGSLEKGTHASMQLKTLKFKASLSSHLFQKHFPIHYNEILSALPLPEYINPVCGLLNLGVKLPEQFRRPELGPGIHFSYGGPDGQMQADVLSKLYYESHDMVNILACVTGTPVSPEQINKIENSMKKCKALDHNRGPTLSNSSDQKGKSPLQSEGTAESGLQDIRENIHLENEIAKVPFRSIEILEDQTLDTENGNISDDSESDIEASLYCCGTIEKSEDTDEYFLGADVESSCSTEDKQGRNSCGSQWDIFRRQDVPKLLEYLRRHSKELNSGSCYPNHAHPILDQNIFLDAFHKLKLKEEFDIQPWTFDQYPGEAVFIPAGCPYQIRKLKSCVNVVFDFVSPENATQCIKLAEEIRFLPMQHKAKRKLLEVGRMALHGISEAVEEIGNLKQVLL
ncbi:lysine-specific demethylase JMJ28-like isoform X1 [Primulina tabacum]|uniref:lysine-specific demethylase JMJ28-like isoform X1 n=1 Tax=Primulina tabacum TaxID=48773 RepID=UPI003F59FC69